MHWYKFLMEFSRGTTPRRSHLVRRYSEETFLEAIDNGYIVKCGETSEGEPMYTITQKGRSVRDD